MTTINANATFNLALASALGSSIAGAAVSLASGVLARFANPLGAGPYAFAKLPSMWQVALSSAAQPQQAPQQTAPMTATTGADGKASIDLGDGYSLQLNENNSEVVITNANTGETTQIWGDPHVNVDGQHAFDFWGTTTFELGNGAKITIDTEQFAANPNAYVASGLTITKGDQAITVNGLSQNQLGDMTVTMGGNGRMIDAMTRDGFVLQENQTGAGWRSELTGQVATQADLDATRPGQAYGPGSSMPSLQELSSMLTSFLAFGMVGAMMAVALEDGGARGSSRAIARR